jgi:RNA polymerase sigma-70 factor (TIGR02960 family)
MPSPVTSTATGGQPGPERERELLAAARRGDERAFGRLVDPHRRPLHAHCYRMLGSLADADDALQETLVAAWRGLPRFEGRSSLRTWLYTIATHASLRLSSRRPRLLPPDRGPSADPRGGLGDPVDESVWVEPYPAGGELGPGFASPEARYELQESVELAFVAAVQHLPATQRAVLILRDVLGFSAEQVAHELDTSTASVNSALQRARKALAERLPAGSQRATRQALGEDAARRLVDRFVAAWERADADAIVALLAEDAVFTMPPLPAWFRGRADIRAFVAERVFALEWRFVAAAANGQAAMLGYRPDPDGGFRLSAVDVLDLRPAAGDGEVAAITAFLDPALLARLGFPVALPPTG